MALDGFDISLLFGHVHSSVGEFIELISNESINSLRTHPYQLVEPSRECFAVYVLLVNRII